MPHELLLNQGRASRSSSVTAASGTGELHKGHGIAFADLDRDGDEDIVAEVGGAVPADRHALRLFENPGNGNDWINLRLVGVEEQPRRDRRADYGHRRRAPADGTRRRRARSIAPSAAEDRSAPTRWSSTSAWDRRLASSAGDLVARQQYAAAFRSVAKNQFIEITEFATDYTPLARKAVRLGGATRGQR